MPQPWRQHLLDLGECADRCVVDIGQRQLRGHPQPDGDGQGLVVLEQQRRQRSAGREPVPARRPLCRVDLVAQMAQPLDVAPDGPSRDAQPLGEFPAGP